MINFSKCSIILLTLLLLVSCSIFECDKEAYGVVGSYENPSSQANADVGCYLECDDLGYEFDSAEEGVVDGVWICYCCN